MKNLLSKRNISILLLFIVMGGVFMIPNDAYAVGWIDGPINSVVNNFAAHFFNMILSVTSWFVYVSGVFLSISMNMTTHIGDFFDNIPALQEVWVLVRNISSIFIIFLLLFESIKTILDVSKPDIMGLIGKIIMVGLFINFSLFFVKAGIDASNLVSLQFYRAIAPESGNEQFGSNKIYYADGGLSAVFMSSLKIPTIYQNSSVAKSADVFGSITIATIAGIIIMITAAFSFMAAAIMFCVRTVVLVFVMALSPLYFVAMIFPQLKDEAAKVEKYFMNQLIFMPTYLFLMYIALRLISSDGFMKIFNQNALGTATTGNVSNVTMAGTVMQYVIALIFINAPLVAALTAGGIGGKWVPELNKIGGFFAQHSLGRAGKKLSEKVSSSSIMARNPNLSVLANETLKKVSGGSFGGSKGGYDARFKDYSKARSDYADKNLKLNDTEKNKYVNEGLDIWSKKTGNLKRKQFEAEQQSKNILNDDKAMEKYRKESAELKLEIKSREDAEKSGSRNKYLEEEALWAKKEAFASSLEGPKDPNLLQRAIGIATFSGITAKARQDAAKAIKKSFGKSEEKKLADMIKKLAKESGEEKEKPADKEGEEGKKEDK